MDKKNLPLVSIIIPVFNDNVRLNHCLKFISQQTYALDDMEVVVVDNGSIPPVSIGQNFSLNIKIIRCEKPGSYAARNAGVKVASGDIFAFTDADCWPNKDWIECGVKALLQNGEKAFVGGEVDMVQSAKPTAVELYQCATGFGQEANIKEKKFTGTLNLFCFRYLFFQVGDFEEQLLSGGDREWSWRALRTGAILIYEPQSIVCTVPRVSLSRAIRQARRVAAGRVMLNKLGLAHMGNENIAKTRSAWQSLVWIFNRNELSLWERFKVFSVALIIRSAEFIERIRLGFGGDAERR